MKKRIIIIGGGFSGLAAACYLAHNDFDVTIVEKNNMLGGRARKFESHGFTFDMGPSWYWMPDVFDNFFADFNKKVSDYYTLQRLDPSYSIHFAKNDIMEIPANFEELKKIFEKYEKGSAIKLEQFIKEAEYKYKVGMNDFVHKPNISILEFMDIRIFTSIFRLQMFSSLSSHVRKLFKNKKIIQLLEFPVLFLGATPQKIPAMYSLMNYADLSLGTWYPKGGMHKIIEGMAQLAKELGVKFELNANVEKLEIKNDKVVNVITKNKKYKADVVVSSADYHHTEQQLLDKKNRNYSKKYWNKRTMAPSSLLFYLGLNKKVKNIQHHNLFFDTDFEKHANEIYENPQWPTQPLFYLCAPSVTDKTVAPENCENLFILIPIASDLEDSNQLREKYFKIIINRLEKLLDQSIEDSIIFKKSFAINDFKKDYNAFKGNAYGLANTLRQTAILKPKIKNKKIKNLFYTGQLTSPGPGVPPALISGKIVATLILNEINKG